MLNFSVFPRMQHGFASRNGVIAAFLSRGGYSGIERVLERGYGGFYSTFGSGDASGAGTQADAMNAVLEDLGKKWQVQNIIIKPYAAMGGLHASIDCVRALQRTHPQLDPSTRALARIKAVQIEMGEVAFKRGGFPSEKWPLEVTEAQMSATYVVATQLLDGYLLPSSYGSDKMKRSDLHTLFRCITCTHQRDFDKSYRTRVTIVLEDGDRFIEEVEKPRGIHPRMTNEDIIEKFRSLTSDLIGGSRSSSIEELVVSLEMIEDLGGLTSQLLGEVKSLL